MMSILQIRKLNISINDEPRIQGAVFEVNQGDVILLTGPNGSGKSTVIKLIMGDIFDYPSLQYKESEIIFHLDGTAYDLLESEKNMELFRRRVCYVSQDDSFESESMLDCFMMSVEHYGIENKERYIFDFVKRYSVADSFYLSGDVKKLSRKCRALLSRLQENDEPTKEEVTAAKFLTLNTRHLSGGQKKLANILTNLIRYEFCDLIILDEPLNNLDYGNVRAFSNILTKIYRSKPQLGILLVTHCRSIPIVTRMLEINPRQKTIGETDGYACNSCFGTIDSDGFYR